MADEKFVDEEFEEPEEVTTMIEYLREAQKRSEGNTSMSMLSPHRYEQLKFCYDTMKYLLRGQNVKVTMEIEGAPSTFGYVSVVGKNIKVSNTEYFARAAEFANNTEIYPRIDGSIVINFGFYGVMQGVKG